MNFVPFHFKILRTLPLWLLPLGLFAQPSNDLEKALIQASEALRQVTVSPQSDAYEKVRESVMANMGGNPAGLEALQSSTGLTPAQRRLAAIWNGQANHSERFETVAPYAKAVPFDATQMLILAGRQVSNQRRRINIARFRLELLHPDMVNATKTYPEIYQAALDLGADILNKADALLKNQERNTANLEKEYARRMEALFDLAEGNPEKLAVIRQIVAAAQPPIFGATYPPPPRLNPDYLLAWEALTMQTPDLELKCHLVRLICGIDPISTMPCLGMVLQQVVTGWKAGLKSKTLEDLYTIVLDHFRDYPSQTGAIVISNAIAYAQSGENPVELPLGTRLSSPHWQMVLRSLTRFPDGKAHIERLQNAVQTPK